MVILGRTYADGTDQDYAAVNALQAKYRIVPLRAYDKPYTYEMPPVNPKPGIQHDRQAAVGDLDMDTSTYFNMMMRLMGGAAPPAPEDAPMLARMAKIGLIPGKPFEMERLDPRRRPPSRMSQDRITAHRGQQGQPGRNGKRLGRN